MSDRILAYVFGALAVLRIGAYVMADEPTIHASACIDKPAARWPYLDFKRDPMIVDGGEFGTWYHFGVPIGRTRAEDDPCILPLPRVGE